MGLSLNKDRMILSKIIKSWAQDHDKNYQIDDPDPTDQGVANTAAFLSWILQENKSCVDLVALLDRLELFFSAQKRSQLSKGMSCKKCKSFCDFAEPNQEDGTLLCYSCRNHPYL